MRVTFELDDALYEKMNVLATDMQRSLDELLVLATQDFYDQERANTDAYLESEEDFKAGRVVPHEEVVAWLQSLSTDHPLPNPAERFAAKLAS